MRIGPQAATVCGTGLLFAVTAFVSINYHAEVRRRAAALYEQGERASSQGRVESALRAYRSALALDRENIQYRLAAAVALYGAKRYGEAINYLSDTLQVDPTNGLANLLAGRILRSRGEHESALSLYQRAVHGSWPDDAAAKRRQARFEFVDYLLRLGRRQRAAAELIQLQEELPPADPARLKVAYLLLAAGEPLRAAREASAIQSQNSNLRREAAILAAEAQMAGNEFVAAQQTLRRALLWFRQDEVLRAKLSKVDAVLAADPTQPRIGTSERRRRSRILLTEVLSVWKSCTGGAAVGKEAPTYVAMAERILKTGAVTGAVDDSDTIISLAMEIWRSIPKNCPAVEDSAARPVIQRLNLE